MKYGYWQGPGHNNVPAMLNGRQAAIVAGDVDGAHEIFRDFEALGLAPLGADLIFA
jgi:hypothetical protein